MSQVLYRKYRPQSFDEVLGQDNIVKTLKSQIKLKTISHAYLFVGSRGTGKTSIARIFAKELGVGPDDIYEIDSASNNSVENIREIIDSTSTLPFNSPFKVYILDEVHMLSKSASNALLKTLEEPPSHVIFILATTEQHKVFDTIASRTEIHTFKKPTVQILKQAVLNVCKQEGFEIDSQTAEMLSLLGDGSFRDTLGNVQKLISVSKDKKLSYDEAVIITGAPKIEIINNFISNFLSGDVSKTLSVISDAKNSGTEALLFCRMVIDKIRMLMLIKFGQQALVKDLISENDLEFLTSLKEDKNIKVDSKKLDRLLSVYLDISKSFIPFLPLELAVVEMIGEKKDEDR